MMLIRWRMNRRQLPPVMLRLPPLQQLVHRSLEAAEKLAKKADVVVHEATFGKERSDLAKEYFHATAEQAATIAKDAGAHSLILTHISQRYQDQAEPLLKEARQIFAATYLAHDFWGFTISRRIKM